MSKTRVVITLLVILAGAMIGYLLWEENRLPVPRRLAPVPVHETPSAPITEAVPAEPAILFPVPEQTAELPAPPPLEESDETVHDALDAMLGSGPARDLFLPQNIIRRIVVTVDNLPREALAERVRPVKAVPGAFMTRTEGGRTYIAEGNAARYTPYVNAFEKLDAQLFNRLYVRFYPLFQTAYRELGYPKGYFNDRLVAVIDHMLAAPTLAGPIQLVQPHVFYRYADPALESGSAGHKLMWRMGTGNAERVKAKLREIRAAVTANSPRNEIASTRPGQR